MLGWDGWSLALRRSGGRRRRAPGVDREAADPGWLTIAERCLYTGVPICGAIGSGKTSACMPLFARQLLGWQAADRRRGILGLVLEVKGTSASRCAAPRATGAESTTTRSLASAGAVVEPARRRPARPLRARQRRERDQRVLRAFPGAGMAANDVDVVRWIIELHRMSAARWMTLRGVYRRTLDAERIEQESPRSAVGAVGDGRGAGWAASPRTGTPWPAWAVEDGGRRHASDRGRFGAVRAAGEAWGARWRSAGQRRRTRKGSTRCGAGTRRTGSSSIRSCASASSRDLG